VVDLRKRFNLPTAGAGKETRVVVIEIDGLLVGMIIDAVTEVLRVPNEVIEPPSSLMMTADSAFITGIARVAERLVILLDLSKVLSIQEQAELQAMPAAV